MSVDVYTYTAQFPSSGAGAARDDIILLRDVGRSMQIKSILFDWMTFEAAGRQYYTPLNAHPDHRVFFEVGTPLATPRVIGAFFVRIAGTSTMIYNGRAFRIFTAGQYHFDSFFCSEEIAFRIYLQVAPGSALAFNTSWNITVETVSQINY